MPTSKEYVFPKGGMQEVSMLNKNFDLDPHSHYVPGQPRMVHLDWQVLVDFSNQSLSCLAIIDFTEGGKTNLDIRDLNINNITDCMGQNVEFSISPMHPVLGSCVTVAVPNDEPKIWVYYKTDPKASALQWLGPEQTSGKTNPFLFSQCQALHAPSCIPCQDTPGVRFTFTASLTVPIELRALMAAGHISREVHEHFANERWEMPQPIPAYLFALAVGELESIDITPRIRVYAEPGVVDAAAAEFADVGKMMEVAEQLAGPYPWYRWDILVLPRSFPYGGMENPRLTFVTPTLITGDKSMVFVLAHELAHSWTGNLVTNSSWRHFWLNEGWTTYFEGRICEALYGQDTAMLQRQLLLIEMMEAFDRFSSEGRPDLTALASYVPAMVDPDDIFSRVPYCKGATFLRALEEEVGRSRFDTFMLAYICEFRFTSIDTATFLDFVAKQLPGALEAIGAWRWVYEAGLPNNAPAIESSLITEVLHFAKTSVIPGTAIGKSWSAPQMALYLQSLSTRTDSFIVASLDKDFDLSNAQNVEVLCSFLLLSLESGYTGVNHKVEVFLGQVGRMKYVLPLFKAMANSPNGVAWARNVLDTVKDGYHPITVAQSERVINEVAALQLTN